MLMIFFYLYHLRDSLSAYDSNRSTDPQGSSEKVPPYLPLKLVNSGINCLHKSAAATTRPARYASRLNLRGRAHCPPADHLITPPI